MLPIKRCIKAMEGRTGSEIARLTEPHETLNWYYLTATGLLVMLVIYGFGIVRAGTMRGSWQGE